MKTLNFYLFLLTALLCGAFFCTDSSARVCFATDPDCGSGGNFGNMDELKQNDCACIAMGYNCPNTSLSSCLKLNSKFEINDKIDWVIKGPISGKLPLSNSQSLTGGYTKIGLTTGTCTADSIKYKCPYNSACVKCCDKSFRYEGCIYPLEIAGKCGDRYKCQCPDEYAISSEYAETNNCQPGGGYCMLNDGTTDTVKYKTCTCDEDIYTDVGSCKNNQTETSSCKDAQGTVRKKCHCDRGVYPYAECMYGPSVGAKTCIDSNSGREYYSRCKTAEEACRTYDEEEDGDSLGTNISSKKHTGFQHNDCSGVHNCRTKDKVYNPATKKYDYLTSYTCILGEQCPYPVNPGLYKCVFDKASWCTQNGYTSTMTTKPTEGAKCTTSDGYEGKYSVCPANDNKSLFYYRCKLPCKTEVRRMAAQNYLVPDVNIVNDEGVAGFYRQVGDEKHLYIIGDVVLPQATTPLNTKGGGWGNIGSKIDYASINGMWALYDVDQVRYESCGDERDEWNYWYDTKPEWYKDMHRPIVKFDGIRIHQWNRFLSKNMSDINIEIYSSDENNPAGFGEEYNIAGGSSLTWKNVTISEPVRAARLCSDSYQGSYFPKRDKCKDNWHGNLIKIDSGAQITFTGKPYFNITASSYGGCGSINCRGGWASSDCPSNQWWCPTDFDQYQTNKSYPLATTRFHWNGNAKAVFKDAEIYSNAYTDWDGAGGQNAMFFYNSKGTMGRVWSTWNIGLDNSDITFNMLRINAYQSANNVFPDWYMSDFLHGRYRCHGVYVTNGSKLKFIDNYARIQSNYAKIYLDWNTELSSEYPIVFGGKESDMICVNSYAKATINGKSYSGKAMIYGSDSSLQAGNNATVTYVTNRWNNNMYTTCTGKCKNNSYTKNTCSSGVGTCYCDTGDGHNYAFYPSKQGTAFCTSCQTCSSYGMGY